VPLKIEFNDIEEDWNDEWNNKWFTCGLQLRPFDQAVIFVHSFTYFTVSRTDVTPAAQ